MRFPVTIPGMERQNVEVKTSQLTGSFKVTINGVPARAGKKRGEFLVPRPDGSTSVIQFVPRLALDNSIRITVDGVPQTLGKPLSMVEIIFVWAPIVLMFIGGMIGGLCAGIAISINTVLFRSKSAQWLKYLGAAASLVCAFAIYLTVAIRIYQ